MKTRCWTAEIAGEVLVRLYVWMLAEVFKLISRLTLRRQATASLLAVPVVLALAQNVGATESIVCASEDKSASADVLVSLGLDVISIVRATIEARGKTWATDATGEQKIVVGQAFEDTEKIVIDFTDDGIATVVASVRLFKASEGEDYVSGGTLRVTGVGAWAVTCSGP